MTPADYHHELDRIFALLRELILAGDGGRAAQVLAAYRALVAAHAAAEEALLVPHLGADARWPAELYTGQHAKLLAGLDRLRAPVAAIDRARAGWRAAALAALDAAAPVMHLSEHHHLAEEQELFAQVAAIAPAALDELVARGVAELARHAPTLAAAAAALDA